jgi:hypothetical protein
MVFPQKNSGVAAHAVLCFEVLRWDCGVSTSESKRHPPKQKRRSDGSPLDEAGQAIVAKIQRAADLSNENCDRAMTLAHKLSMELRAAEDRINELEAEVRLFRDRAARAHSINGAYQGVGSLDGRELGPGGIVVDSVSRGASRDGFGRRRHAQQRRDGPQQVRERETHLNTRRDFSVGNATALPWSCARTTGSIR